MPWVRRTPPNLSQYDSVFKTLITLNSLKNGRVLFRSGPTGDRQFTKEPSGFSLGIHPEDTHAPRISQTVKPRLYVGSTLTRYLISGVAAVCMPTGRVPAWARGKVRFSP